MKTVNEARVFFINFDYNISTRIL